MQKSHKRLIENIFSLSLLNGINMIIPLVTLPYLIKTIGIANYGSYSIVYAMIQYGILFSAYGFSFSTTQQISINRDNIETVSAIFGSVIVARLMIAIVAMIIMAIICIAAFDSKYFLMYLLGLGMIIGDILNPTWLYQGMEKMRFMTIINFISKTLFTVLIFIFIRNQSDYLYVTLLNSCGFLIAGFISCIIGIKYFKLSLKLPKFTHIKDQLKNGWYIFLSTICMTLYRNSNIFILGFFLSPAMIGIYSGAEKVIKAAQAVTTPISNALFPFVAKSFADSPIKRKFHLIRKLSMAVGIMVLIISLGTFFGTPIIVKVLLSDIGYKAELLIKIMTPVIFFGGLNYILGIVGLVNLNHQKTFFHYVMISGVLSFIVLIFFAKGYGIYAAGWSMVLTEVLLFFLCLSKLFSLNKQLTT